MLARINKLCYKKKEGKISQRKYNVEKENQMNGYYGWKEEKKKKTSLKEKKFRQVFSATIKKKKTNNDAKRRER